MIIDIAFAVVMLLAVFKGWYRGFVVALFSVLALLLGAAAALKLSSVVAAYWQAHFHSEGAWIPVVSFVLVFLAVAFLVRLAARAIEALLKLTLLGWLNKLAGVLLYLFLYAVLFSIVLWFCNQLYWIDPSTKTASVTYPYLAPLGPYIVDAIGALLPVFRDLFSDLEKFFESLAVHLHQA